MNCPRCDQGHDGSMIRTVQTMRYDNHDYRYHICMSCGCRWTSVSRIDSVLVYNPEKMAEEPVPLDVYKSRYSDYHLGRAKHPTAIQGALFDEHI